MADKPKLIKVCLTNRGHDTETPWAEDLGALEGTPNARRAKIVNVPFLHAKPTWGDIVAVTPGTDGVLTWDRDNVPWKSIGGRILEDGGRWAMIIDYAPRAGTKGADSFNALARACESLDIVCEGAWSPKAREPGRAYLAVRKDLADHAVMSSLRDAQLPLDLTQVHPDPKAKEPKETKPAASLKSAKPAAASTKSAKPAAAKPESAKPAASKPESAKPAAAKPESAKPEAAKPEVAKPAASKPEPAKPLTNGKPVAAPAAPQPTKQVRAKTAPPVEPAAPKKASRPSTPAKPEKPAPTAKTPAKKEPPKAAVAAAAAKQAAAKAAAAKPKAKKAR